MEYASLDLYTKAGLVEGHSTVLFQNPLLFGGRQVRQEVSQG